MTSYAIDKATGRLGKLKEYPMGKNPNWVEIVRLLGIVQSWLVI